MATAEPLRGGSRRPGDSVAGRVGAATLPRVAGRSTPATTALDRARVPYRLHAYDHDPRAESFGAEAAAALGVEESRLFKTLVATVDGSLVVGVVPVSGQLDLRALAAAVGAKKATMADVAAAERVTGYVHGGISPLGHRTRLRVVVDETATGHETVFCSAGRRGLQLELAPEALIRTTGATVAPIAGQAPGSACARARTDVR